MKTRWKILTATGIFLVLLVSSMLFSAHFQSENEAENYKQLLLGQGEKLQVSQLIPPPVPAESNSVDAVRDAFRMFVPGEENIPDAMRIVAPGKAMIGWAQPDARGYDFTNSWEDFAAGVNADQPAIDSLHQVLERPVLDFQLDYNKGIDLLLPHLAPMKRAVQMLDAATICKLHFGDTGAAVTNIITMLGLVQRNASKDLLISHLVRIAMTSITVSSTWEFLQATNVTDAQLAAVQKGWEQLDFFADGKNAFEMERAWGISTIQMLRTNRESISSVFGMGSAMSSSGSPSGGWFSATGLRALTQRPRYAIGEAMWRSSWSYSDELHLLKSETIIINTFRQMQTNHDQNYKAEYDAMQKQLSAPKPTYAGMAFFRALEIPDMSGAFGSWSLGNAVEKTLNIEAARRLAITAIALKRFQLRNGHLPQTLADLVPEFLSSVSIDPYDGKPLHYQLNADGTFLLYSVAENGVDDGGDATEAGGTIFTQSHYWQYRKARDWVWPQPAAPAEVQYFREHPSN